MKKRALSLIFAIAAMAYLLQYTPARAASSASTLVIACVPSCQDPCKGGERAPALSADGREGARLLSQGQWARAAEAFQRAVDRGTATSAEREGLAYALLKAGQPERAAAIYEGLSVQFPNQAAFWINLGLAYATQKTPRLDAAENAFKRGLELRPHDPNALENLAVVLHRHAHLQLQEALSLTQRALAAAPGKGYVLTELGDVLRDLGDYPEALQAYQRALAASSWPPARLGLARLFYARASYSAAASYASDFLHLSDAATDRVRWAQERADAEELIRQAQRQQKVDSALPSPLRLPGGGSEAEPQR